jgi:hypothetical protein
VIEMGMKSAKDKPMTKKEREAKRKKTQRETLEEIKAYRSKHSSVEISVCLH